MGVDSSARRSEVDGTRVNLTADYVPVGATTVAVTDASGFAVDDVVVLERAGSEEWIASIGMDAIEDCEEPDCYHWDADSYVLEVGNNLFSLNSSNQNCPRAFQARPLSQPRGARKGYGRAR